MATVKPIDDFATLEAGQNDPEAKEQVTSVKKDMASAAGSGGASYRVEIHWQAQTFDGWTYSFLEYGTHAIVQEGGEAWDANREIKVKLDVEDNGKAMVKTEVHHICCAHEMEAGGNINVDSGSWGSWGSTKNCRCEQLWYDHQVRAKVTKVDIQGEDPSSVNDIIGSGSV
ncbi:hypothetical protein ACHAWF_011901 [Thalassiosira exigua]